MIVDNQTLKDNIKKDKQTIQELLKIHSEIDVYPYATFSLFSRYVELEQFIINSYIGYALGNSSVSGFRPLVIIDFKNEEILQVFHKRIDRFITIKIIKETYIYVFGDGTINKNPFEAFFNIEYGCFEELETIRNVIAHQSEESYKKFYKKCNNGAPCTLEDYLFKYNGGFSNYYKWLDFIEKISETIVNPI